MRYILQAEYTVHPQHRGGYKIAAYDGGYFGLYYWLSDPRCPEFCEKRTGFVQRALTKDGPVPESEGRAELPETARWASVEEIQEHVAESNAMYLTWTPV